MALYLDLSTGEVIDIDSGRVVITVEEKNGRRTRLKIDAERSIKIQKVSGYEYRAARVRPAT